MKTIPETMRQKLLNRFKASSTDSEPAIRVVATQSSTNTLLTEPIHEDEDPNFGDVALRQMEGEESVSLAYALCLDEGIPTVYRRSFPATMEYPWEKMFTLTEAADVAIEFDGQWTMSNNRDWYYLVTEEFPYLFTVEDGDLYVQKWRDTTSRILLAEGVSQISACRGWTSSINLDDDQGLIIGYLKDGGVYYRTYAYSTASSCKNWELEQQVTSLGSNNTTLSVIRTNDFRIGFMTQQEGRIKMALTKRNYPGASVKPEYFHVQSNIVRFNYVKARRHFPLHQEYVVSPDIDETLFLMVDENASFLSVVSAERQYTTEGSSQICSGAIVYLNKSLTTTLTQKFKQGCTVSSEKLSITDVSYDSEQNALIYSFSWNSGYTPDTHPTAFTVTFPRDFNVRYVVANDQKWYVEGGTGTLEKITISRYGYENETLLRPSTSATIFTYLAPDQYRCPDTGSFTVATSSASFTYIPIGDIPI